MGLFSIGICALAAALLSGCGNHQSSSSDHAPHLHVDTPPHGGTAVALGDDYQIEFVLDAPAGRLEAFVLDDEMENFIRVAAESFEVTAKLPARTEGLVFKAVPNAATGETVGDTSMFETQADWLKNVKTFDAILKQLDVKGNLFTNVAFNFPKGDDKDEKKN